MSERPYGQQKRPYGQQNTTQKTNLHNIIGILLNVVSNTAIIEWKCVCALQFMTILVSQILLINTLGRRDQAQCIRRTLLVEIFKNKIIQKLLVARTAGQIIIRRPTIVRKQIVLLKFNCNSLLKEKFEWVFRSRKSNDRQYNDQKKKRTSSDLQNNTQKTNH